MTAYEVAVSHTLSIVQGDGGLLPSILQELELFETLQGFKPDISQILVLTQSIPSPIIKQVSQNLSITSTVTQHLFYVAFKQDRLVLTQTIVLDSTSVLQNPKKQSNTLVITQTIATIKAIQKSLSQVLVLSQNIVSKKNSGSPYA